MANPVDISPSLGHGLLTTQAGFGLGFDAIDDRRFWTGYERGEGVSTYESFRVRQRGAGANMTVDVGMDEGAYVRGDAVSLQGLYYAAPHNATINVDITAADPTNPRIDRVVLEIKDDTHDAGGLNKARIRTIAGTPTGGATLDNLTGAAAVPASAILLADALVPALATTVVDANIRDRRPFTTGVPPLLTDVDQVAMLPVAAGRTDLVSVNSVVDLHQAAALMLLPRRIVAATRIRWKYSQDGTTALTGNYVIGIYDASGRRIVDTGSVAVAGAINTFQARAETIAATTFEPGLYYVLFGMDTTNAGIIYYPGPRVDVNVGINVGGVGPNMMLRSATGGVTPPTTLLAMTDTNGIATSTGELNVPLVTLSVG